jgi:serine protease Do
MPLPKHLFQDELVKAIKEVTPSVVSVSTLALIRDYYRVHPVSGVGSGVVLDRNGHVVTNRHVIHHAQRLSLADSNGKRFEASLLGSDQLVDIAILRVENSTLPPATLADSDQLEVGQLAIAIGNPYGFILGGPTVTTGVVSAVNRQIQAENMLLDNLIQTDAAINPGNSGGPLVDVEGHVIGINTATIPFAQGIGFAIPINTVKEVASEIIQHGHVRRAFMGFLGLQVTPQIAHTYRLAVQEGILIARVVPNSPASRAGLQEGDIIVAINEKPIKTMIEVHQLLRKYQIGSSIQARIVRGQKQVTLNIILGEVPA